MSLFDTQWRSLLLKVTKTSYLNSPSHAASEEESGKKLCDSFSVVQRRITTRQSTALRFLSSNFPQVVWKLSQCLCLTTFWLEVNDKLGSLNDCNLNYA